MNTKVLITLISLLSVNFAIAKNTFGFQVGLNNSAFYKIHTEVTFRFVGGFFVDLPIKNNQIFSVGLNYLTRGGVLKNLSVEPYGGYSPPSEINIADFSVLIHSVELPINIKFKYKRNAHFSILPMIGLSVIQPIYDSTVRKNEKRRFEENPNFDVMASDGATGNETTGTINIGSSIYYKKILFNFIYQHDIKNLEGVKTIYSIDNRIHSFQFSIGYLL